MPNVNELKLNDDPNQKPKVNYLTWFVNDVMPDELVPYQAFDIQKFLSQRGSFLKDYKIGTDAYSTWLDALCKKNNINAKMIMVTLQKEQSIVMMGQAPGEKKMDRCLGYGMTDSGDIKKWYGFQKQHEGAIAQVAKDFTKFSKTWPQPKQEVDDGLLTIQPFTAHTSLLYKYTPWTGSPDSVYYSKWGIHGAYLYWTLWKQWWPEDLKNYNHKTLEEALKKGG